MTSVSKKPAYVKPPQRRGNCAKWTCSIERKDASVIISPMYCESWRCPVCGAIKLSKLIDKLVEVELVQYVEITLPHRYTTMRRELASWLKLVKRQSTRFEYLMIVSSQRDRTRIGLFLESGTLPRKWVEESFATYGLTAVADTETLYRREGRKDKLTALLNVGADQDTIIHRVSHSRKLYVKAAPGPPADPKARVMVSRVPLHEFLDYVEKMGLPTVQLLPDVFLISASCIGDRGLKPFDVLFPGRAPPGMSSTQAKQADCRT